MGGEDALKPSPQRDDFVRPRSSLWQKAVGGTLPPRRLKGLLDLDQLRKPFRVELGGQRLDAAYDSRPFRKTLKGLRISL